MHCALFLVSLPFYRYSVGFQMERLENIYQLLEGDFQIVVAKTLDLWVTRELGTRRQSSRVHVERGVKSYSHVVSKEICKAKFLFMTQYLIITNLLP